MEEAWAGLADISEPLLLHSELGPSQSRSAEACPAPGTVGLLTLPAPDPVVSFRWLCQQQSLLSVHVVTPFHRWESQDSEDAWAILGAPAQTLPHAGPPPSAVSELRHTGAAVWAACVWSEDLSACWDKGTLLGWELLGPLPGRELV